MVTTGHYCTAQGIFLQIGQVGVALISIVRLTFITTSFGQGPNDMHFASFLPSTLS